MRWSPGFPQRSHDSREAPGPPSLARRSRLARGHKSAAKGATERRTTSHNLPSAHRPTGRPTHARTGEERAGERSLGTLVSAHSRRRTTARMSMIAMSPPCAASGREAAFANTGGAPVSPPLAGRERPARQRKRSVKAAGSDQLQQPLQQVNTLCCRSQPAVPRVQQSPPSLACAPPARINPRPLTLHSVRANARASKSQSRLSRSRPRGRSSRRVSNWSCAQTTRLLPLLNFRDNSQRRRRHPRRASLVQSPTLSRRSSASSTG